VAELARELAWPGRRSDLKESQVRRPSANFSQMKDEKFRGIGAAPPLVAQSALVSRPAPTSREWCRAALPPAVRWLIRGPAEPELLESLSSKAKNWGFRLSRPDQAGAEVEQSRQRFGFR
jgi:hypothetical protein